MSPAWSGSPDRCENMSPTLTIWVTAGSDSANHGSFDTIGVSQPIAFSPTWWATTVERDRLGHRRQLEDGVGVHLIAASLDILDTEALGVDGLSAVHHRHRHPGNAGFLHQVVGDAVKLGDRVLDGVLRQRHRGHQRRRHVGQRRRRLVGRRLRLFGRSGIAAPPPAISPRRARPARQTWCGL